MRVDLVDVTQQFPTCAALFDKVTLALTPGAPYALTGPSGSGKTTLLGIISGLVKPTSGTVTRVGVGRVQWVFQNPHGVAERSALDHVVFPLVAAGLRRRLASYLARDILERFGLIESAEKHYALLSGGEAARLMLARSVAARANLMLIDEPTAQLDAKSAHDVISVLGQLADRNTIVVIATHDARVAAACPRGIDVFAHV